YHAGTAWSRIAMTNRDEHENAVKLGLDSALEAHGFNLVGALAADRYDQLVAPGWRCAQRLPTARSAVLLCCGGPEFFRAVRSSPEWQAGVDPVDRFARRWVEFQRAAWQRAGFDTKGFLYVDERDSDGESHFADFASLAAACGIGVPSRLGILLHPRYGPWVSIRGLLLTERPCPAAEPLDWNPCLGCPAPCAGACPSDRVILGSGFDLEACFATKASTPSCRTGCAARRACVYGRDQAYDRDAEAYYTESAWLLGARAHRDVKRRDPPVDPGIH
ncbi:MAG: hypothetical protein AAEJ52_08045, partial [Myxococcota bacterium]